MRDTRQIERVVDGMTVEEFRAFSEWLAEHPISCDGDRHEWKQALRRWFASTLRQGKDK